MRLRDLVWSLMLAAAPAAAQAPQTSGVDRAAASLLNTFGLTDLTPQQHERAIRLVKALAASGGDDVLAESADSYMQNEGYEPVDMAIVSVGGTDYLVVEQSFGRVATKDIPYTVRTYSFRDGKHYAKRSFQGVSEFIDDDGDVQSITFANWIELR